ncbi:MAG: hypothetical protein RL235_702 [Chlamydiota bacterium]|jgi:hypothetical protein
MSRTTKVIEPSEIIIDASGLPREDLGRATPWMRFLARLVDYAFVFLAITAIPKILHTPPPRPDAIASLIPFQYFIWIPVESALLTLVGTTPGKWFLAVRLRQGRKARLDWMTALRRSFNVWFRGLGMGIAFINVLCLFTAYRRVSIFHTTSWDLEESIMVTGAPVSRWRIVVALAFAVGCMAWYSWGT